MTYSMNTQVTEPKLIQLIRPAVGLTLVGLLVCGFSYSSVATGLGQVLFPNQANGSMLVENQKIVGSKLVAQAFVGDQYFYARPSAVHYDVMALAGSNLARTNPELSKIIDERRALISTREHVAIDKIPSDIVTSSGSGIDPEISPAAAQLQVNRVAQARHLSIDQLNEIVKVHTQGPAFGLLGQARVNVLELNLALDRLHTSAK